jgi:hypothetical protein
MRYLPFMGALLLAHCVRSPSSLPTHPEEDTSIVFPQFFGADGTKVGEPGKPYDLDGATLQALMVAVNDFLPSHTKERHCWSRPEGHRYRIIRQEDIIFVQIRADLHHCERGFMMMDYGVKYAISTDGRILRRLFSGDPSDSVAPASPETGDAGLPPSEDFSAELGATGFGSSIAIPRSWLDGGSPQSPPVDSPPPLLNPP